MALPKPGAPPAGVARPAPPPDDPPTSQTVHTVSFDVVMPPAIAERAELSGAARGSTDAVTLSVLSLLGGAFVALGAVFATTVSAGVVTFSPAGAGAPLTAALPYGIVRLLVGVSFSLGLILVALAGAELFTGNNLVVMAWASRKVSTRQLLRNWLFSFLGNCAGAIATAALLFMTTQYTFGNGAVGLNALAIANAKTSLDFFPALTLGIVCNALVCLAVWMGYGARTIVDKIAAFIFPVAAFAAAGFEHCIANAYFIPMGLFIKAGAPQSFWTTIGRTPADYPALTWYNFIFGNLIPVTIGNAIGGSILVAGVYWFVYLRRPSISP